MTTQTKALDAPLKINTQHIMVSLLVVATFVFFTSIGLNHQEGEAYGWMSLLPTGSGVGVRTDNAPHRRSAI